MNDTDLKWYQKSKYKFILLSIFALATTSLITLSQADLSLRTHLKKIDLESIRTETVTVKNSLINDLIYIRSVGKFASNLSYLPDQERIAPIMQAMVNASNNIVAIQIINSDPSKNIIKVSERRFVEANNSTFLPLRTPISLLGERLIERNIGKNKNLLRIESASSEDGIPIVMIGAQFESAESAPWVVVHVIESHFQRLFRKNSQFASALLNSTGKTILSAPENRDSSLISQLKESEFRQFEQEKGPVTLLKEKEFNGVPLLENTTSIDMTDLLLVTQSLRIGERNFVQNLYNKTFALNLMLVLAFTLLVYFISLLMSLRLRRLSKAVLSFGQESFEYHPPKKIRDEISQLEFAFSTSAHRIGESVENIKQEIQKKYEVRIYEDTMHPICPKSNMIERGISTFAFFKPAQECPGDWWGRFQIGRNKEIIVLADAQGRDGISSTAAILTYAFFKTINTLRDGSSEEEISATKILQDLNSIIYSSLNGKAEIKVFVMVFDLEKMISTAASGGHCHPFLIDERFTGTVNCNGEALGKKPRAEVDEVLIRLHAGQRFVFHTDGIFNSRNAANESLDRTEFFKQLGEHRKENISKYAEFFFSKLKLHFQDEPHNDDLTMIILEVHDAQLIEASSKTIQESKSEFPKIDW